jgi:hypothetical protein
MTNMYIFSENGKNRQVQLYPPVQLQLCLNLCSTISLIYPSESRTCYYNATNVYNSRTILRIEISCLSFSHNIQVPLKCMIRTYENMSELLSFSSRKPQAFNSETFIFTYEGTDSTDKSL